jgi:hypothetical protein
MRQEIALIAQAETSSGLRAPPLLMALEMVK